MNSLEALKKIEEELYLTLPKNIRDTLIQTIKQDLEVYAQLKQDHDITLINNGELVVKVADLQKENQELIVNKNVAQAVAFDQKREIGELKDQISYLKEDGKEWQSAYEWSQAQNSILKLKNQELEEENQKLKKDYNLLDTTMESDDRIINSLLNEKEQLKNDIKLNETQIDDLTLEVANYKHALEEKNEIIMELKERLSKYE